MHIDKTKIINKLDNHQKLLSMINSSMMPIKETLIQDIVEIRAIIETASKYERQNDRNRTT
jgi:hypothetical protein